MRVLWKTLLLPKCVCAVGGAQSLADGVPWFARCKVPEVVRLCVEINDSGANNLINILLPNSPVLTLGLKSRDFPVSHALCMFNDKLSAKQSLDRNRPFPFSKFKVKMPWKHLDQKETRKLANLYSKDKVIPSHQLDELCPRRWSWWPLLKEPYCYRLCIAFPKVLLVIIMFTPHGDMPSDVVMILTPWSWTLSPAALG